MCMAKAANARTKIEPQLNILDARKPDLLISTASGNHTLIDKSQTPKIRRRYTSWHNLQGRRSHIFWSIFQRPFWHIHCPQSRKLEALSRTKLWHYLHHWIHLRTPTWQRSHCQRMGLPPQTNRQIRQQPTSKPTLTSPSPVTPCRPATSGEHKHVWRWHLRRPSTEP